MLRQLLLLSQAAAAPARTDPSEYLPLYNASARALKSVHPTLRVGGPATATLAHLVDFASRAAAAGRGGDVVPIDFISSHFYPSEANCTNPHALLGRDPDCFSKSVLAASRRLATAMAAGGGGARVPFLLTEFNSGLQGGPGTGEAGPQGDTAYAASFAIRNVPLLATANIARAAAQGGAADTAADTAAVELASWWAVSDIFEEGWMSGVPFYGGFGLLNTQGVAKPSYRAFQLLAGTGAYHLPVTLRDPSPDYPHIGNHSTVSALATVDDGGDGDGGDGGAGAARTMRGLQILLSNFAPERGASGAPWAPRARNVSLRLIAAGSAPHCRPAERVQMQRIDDVSTNPRKAWLAMGSPDYPNAKQLAQLHAASEMPKQQLAAARAKQEANPCASTVGPIEIPAYGVVHLGSFEAAAS